ncbi:MAG: rhamnulose-1-phosphate aldolase [Bacteroidales bacterium]|nr:rhamnulose-1-phosphate aldolase [Bacteroidales bacterium]
MSAGSDIIAQLSSSIPEIARFLWEKGWAEANAGNMSIRIDELPQTYHSAESAVAGYELPKAYPGLEDAIFVLTGAGKRMRQIAQSSQNGMLIIQLNEKAGRYKIFPVSVDQEVDFKPTSELPTHLAVHQMMVKHGMPERAIVHAHVTELIALTHIEEYTGEENLNNLLWSMHPEIPMMLPHGAGLVPSIMPGTEEIAHATVEKFKSHKAVIWEKHGGFAIGNDVQEAFDRLDILAKAASIYFTCKSSGNTAQGVDSDLMRKIKTKFQP